jgi:hypothetical protein
MQRSADAKALMFRQRGHAPADAGHWPDFVEVDHGEQAKMEQELFEGSLIEQAASFMLYSQTLRDKAHER